jgi:transcriptional antiterminator NusG
MNIETNTEFVEEGEMDLAQAAEVEETGQAPAEESAILELAADESDGATAPDEEAGEQPIETSASPWLSPTGKRLGLKERLAARRLEELGEETSDQEGRWYVLHTYSGYENKVKKTIETRVESLDLADRVYEVVVPTQEEIEIKNGQRQTVLRKVFPGYVLVRMVLDDETWYALRNTPGVTGFVNVDNKPVPLDEARVQSIMKGMVAEAPKVKVTFQVGDTVRINDGPFADFRGEIDEINQEKGKIRVMVSFFGRETPVELDFLQAEREM